jgi:hypothetical protein
MAGVRDTRLYLGVLCLKSQISSTPPKRRRASKKQTSSKLQAPHQKDGGQANHKEIPKFVISNFGHEQRRRLRRVLLFV